MLMRPVLPLASYSFNYDYIAESLCVNKDRPEMQCHGKCHLSKQLLEQHHGETSQHQPPSTRGHDISFPVGLLSTQEVYFAQAAPELFLTTHDELNQSHPFIAEIAHPPES